MFNCSAVAKLHIELFNPAYLTFDQELEFGKVSEGYKQLSSAYYKKQEPFSKDPLLNPGSPETENPLLDLKEIEVLRQPELDNLLQEISEEDVNNKESL